MKDLQEAGAQSFGGSVFNGFSDPAPRSALSDKGLHYAFKDAEQLARLNAFVNSFLGGTYMDPKEPLKELAGRIGQLGLSMRFDNNIKLTAGYNEIPLAVFGEKFGVTPTTDLSQGFDTGADYPDMVLCFTLLQTKTGYVFTDAHIKSQLCTDCPQEVGSEMDNTHANSAVIGIPVPQNESYITEEKDEARSVELFLSKSSGKGILQPIYQSLKSLKKRGKYTEELAMKRFEYAVNSAIRRMSSKDNIVSLTDDQKVRASNRLLINFEKHIRSIED